MNERRVRYVGIDWGHGLHQVCATDSEGQIHLERSFEASASGLSELVTCLLKACADAPHNCWVALEVPHGPVVETLMDRMFCVYSINPKQLDRFRDRFSVAGAKDDRRDAQVLASSLRTDSQAFRLVVPTDPTVMQLREYSRMREELLASYHQAQQRLVAQLRRYFPAWLELGASGSPLWLLKLWERAPTPAHAKRIPLKTIRNVLRKYRVRRLSAEQVRDVLRQPALSVAAGTCESAVAHIRMLLPQLYLLTEQIRQTEQEIDRLIGILTEPQGSAKKDEQPDAAVLQSLPGVGPTVLAALLSEASEPLRRRDYHALRTLSGVAPVTRQSGQQFRVQMRYACSLRLRNAVYHWARVASQRDELSKRKYAALRARGHRHGRALRSVADRLLYVACAALKHHALFDPQRRPAHAAQAA